MINNLVNTRKPELTSLVAKLETVNDVPSGSSILKGIEKEGNKRKFVQDRALPFVFGILSRSNDNYGVGGFITELGKWAQEVENADSMLQLLNGCHEYTTKYSGFYLEPKLKELIMDGKQPKHLNLQDIIYDIPLSWKEQEGMTAKLYK